MLFGSSGTKHLLESFLEPSLPWLIFVEVALVVSVVGVQAFLVQLVVVGGQVFLLWAAADEAVL